MDASGPGQFVIIEGTMNSALYLSESVFFLFVVVYLSPDWTQIEVLWQNLKRAVNAEKIYQFIIIIIKAAEEWIKMAQQQCERLVSTYWCSVEIIAAEGGETSYYSGGGNYFHIGVT